MRRPFVTMTFTLAAALAPAVLFAQAAPPAQQPAAQQPPATTAPATTAPATTAPATTAPAAPAEPPKVGFTTPAGILLVQIKPDQTAVFEEMIGKLKAGLAKTEDAALKQQASGFKVFKAAEPFGANALYVVMMEPASANAEYELFAMMQKTMTDDEKRAPETAAMWKRYTDAFAAGLSKLSLTPIGG
ncbi:MAG: hypothetical protein ABJC89_23595 [Acidobacteriota bacterium]